MTLEQRNTIFSEYRNLINFTVHRHRSFQEAMRMEAEDLKQELALCLLRAIELYQPDRGAKPSTYYIKMLKYGVLNLWREQVREKRLANLYAKPLTYTDDDGEETVMELPVEVDYDTELWVKEFVQTLSERERDALEREMDGIEYDRRQQRYMNIVRRKAMRFSRDGGIA